MPARGRLRMAQTQSISASSDLTLVMRADNFSTEELPEIMGYLHRYGVRGYCHFQYADFHQ